MTINLDENSDVLVLNNIDELIVTKKHKSPLPKGWVIAWLYAITILIDELTKNEIKVLFQFLHNARRDNVARISRLSIAKNCNMRDNHVDAAISKLRKRFVVRELHGGGFQINPRYILIGNGVTHKELLDEWEEYEKEQEEMPTKKSYRKGQRP